MRSHIVALALAALAVTALAHEGHEHEDEELEEDPKAPSDVLVLTDATYQDAISQNPLILVEYYAPWCGHCQRLAPEYEKAATLLKGIAVVAKVDATKNEATAQAAEISGFPTLRLFSNGKPVEYRQERTAEAIVSFVKKAAEPGMKELKSAEEVAKFREENPTAVVAFFAEVEAEKEGAFTFGTYAKVVENLKLSSTTAFSFVSNAEFLGLPADAKAVVKMFRKADAKEVAFDIATFVDDASFAKWAAISALLPLDEISQSNFQSYFELRLPLFWLLLDPAADNVAVKATVEKIANEHFGKVLFVWLDSVKFPGQAKHIGLNGGKTPAGSLFVGSEKYPFPEDKEMTEEALNQFVSDALAGKLENFIRSSEIPEDNEQRNVFEIVGKTYKQVVEDTERDVVVEFFAEYCGHCKALAPVYDELGRLLKGVNSVRIARINVPDNDVPANIQGFPTVMLFKSDDKQNPVVYDGDRTLSSLLNWIKANAKTPFEFSEEAAAAAAAAEPKPVEENPKEEL